eukprot:scaffold11531_cov157-Skeletonema_menzelii.AAC.2
MVAIFDCDVRRATANEHRLLNAPMSVSAGSKHVGINIVIHTNDQPTAALSAARCRCVLVLCEMNQFEFSCNDGEPRLIIGSIEVVTRHVGTSEISPNFEYRLTDETVPGSMGSNKT